MYVIIGQGAAGTTAALELRRYEPDARILMLSRERLPFYNRIRMPDIVAGKIAADEVVVHDAAFFANQDIECRLGAVVTHLDTVAREIGLESGEKIGYGKLLLATGSRPLMPPIPGLDGPDVFTLWTADDAEKIRDRAKRASSAVVMGAGLIGLKTATALQAHGLAVTVVEKAPRVMPRQLDETGAVILAETLESSGLAIHCGLGVASVKRDNGEVSGVTLDDGSFVVCDFVVAAVGVLPDMALAKAAGLETGRGIFIDANAATSAPDVFAAGDVAELRDPVTGEGVVPAIWPVAVDQGRAAAASMTGYDMPAPALPPMNSVEIGNLPLASVGDIAGTAEDTVLVSRKNGAYCRLVVRNNVPRGVLCLGDITRAGVLGNLVRLGRPLPACDPLAPSFSYGNLLFAAGKEGFSPMETVYANS